MGMTEMAAVGIAAAGGLCVLVAIGAVALVIFLRGLRNRGPAAPTRDGMLRELGYTPAGEPKTWARPFAGSKIVFSEAKGFRWSVRLPRYNTLTVGIEERDGGATPAGRPFETEKPILDRRFVFAASPPSTQTVALVTTPIVTNALLDLRCVSLVLSGDELVISDPKRQNLADGVEPIEAERAAHLGVETVVTALFDTMFSKQSGTIMPEFR